MAPQKKGKVIEAKKRKVVEAKKEKNVEAKKEKDAEAKKRKVVERDDVWLKHDIYPPRASTSRIITRSQTSFLRIENSNSDTDLFGDSNLHHPPKKRHLLTTMKGDFGGIPRTLMTRSTADFLSLNIKLCEEIETYKVYMQANLRDNSADNPDSSETRMQSEALKTDESTHVQMNSAAGLTSPQTVTQPGILGTIGPTISQPVIAEQLSKNLLVEEPKGLIHTTGTADQPLMHDPPSLDEIVTPGILGEVGPTISQPMITEQPSKNPLAEEPKGLLHSTETTETANQPLMQDPPSPDETVVPGILGEVGPTISQPVITEQPSKNPLAEEPKGLIHTTETAGQPLMQDPPSQNETVTPEILGEVGPTISQPMITEQPSKNPLAEDPKGLIHTTETADQPLMQDPPTSDETVTPGIQGEVGPTISQSKVTDQQQKDTLADEHTNTKKESETATLEKIFQRMQDRKKTDSRIHRTGN